MDREEYPSRRMVLGAIGSLGLLAACSGRPPSAQRTPQPTASTSGAPGRLTVRSWAASRPAPFFIAHRGAGDVFPEHSMVGYRGAFEQGARCLEVSVDITSDGVLVCMHDLTYNRTTTGTGAVADLPASVLDSIGIRQPQLGPAWVQPPLPPVPRLEEVLTVFGGRAVLCLEAKDDNAYAPMIALVQKMGLLDTVILKAYHASHRIADAKAIGLPIFSYVSPADMSSAVIARAAGALQASSDYLVLPATTGDDVTYYPASLISAARSSGIALMVYPVHRRADAAYYFALGVAGAVTSDYGYSVGTVATATADTWASKRIATGELPKKPDSRSLAGAWTGSDELTLAAHGVQQFITLGQLSPVTSASSAYRIRFSAMWQRLPSDSESGLSLVFAHRDDRWYEQGLGVSDGYHASLSPGGTLRLHRHQVNQPDTLLAELHTPAVRAGQWVDLQLDVSSDTLSWARTDVAPGMQVSARDSAFRGGYLHIGKTSHDDQTVLSLRRFTVG